MLVGKKAIDFRAKAVMPDNEIKDVHLKELVGPKGVVLFFYPKDFTIICPTEIISFDKKLQEFKDRGYNVVSVSTDTEFSHLAWKKLPVSSGGIGNVQFPMVSDISKDISRWYDVLGEDTTALRGTFVIDRDFIVKHAVVNDMDISRSIDDALRTIDVVEHVREFGELCPANWTKQEKFN